MTGILNRLLLLIAGASDHELRRQIQYPKVENASCQSTPCAAQPDISLRVMCRHEHVGASLESVGTAESPVCCCFSGLS